MFLRDKRARLLERVQLVQEGSGALLLFSAGTSGLEQHSGQILSAVQIALAGALLVSIARELWQLRSAEPAEHKQHPGARIGWVNLFAGLALVLEGVQKIGAGSKLIHWPYFLQAMISLGFAFFGDRFERFRARWRVLRLDGTGMHFRLNVIRRFHVARSDIASLEIDGRRATVLTHAGRRRRIALVRLENAAEVEAALRAWAKAAGVPVADLP